MIEVLQDGDLGPEAGPDRAELQADVSSADDHQVLGHLGVTKGLSAGADALAVGFDARQFGRAAAGGNDDVLRADFLEPTARRRADRRHPTLASQLRRCQRLNHHAAGPGNAAATRVARNLVLLEQGLDALGQAGDDLFLAVEHGRQVELDAGDLDAVLGQRVPGGGVALGRFEQGLAGNAANAEAGSTEGRFHFDAGDVQTELSGTDRGDVAARTGADDDEIVLLHFSTPKSFWPLEPELARRATEAAGRGGPPGPPLDNRARGTYR